MHVADGRAGEKAQLELEHQGEEEEHDGWVPFGLDWARHAA